MKFLSITLLASTILPSSTNALPPGVKVYDSDDPEDPLSDAYWFNRELAGRYPRHSVSPPFKSLERRFNLTREEFINEYAIYGKPVIVTDSIDDWDWSEMNSWTASSLREKFPGEVHNRYPRVGEELFDNTGKIVGFNTKEDVAKMLPHLEAETTRSFTKKEHMSWLNRDPAVSAELQKFYDLPPFLQGVGEKEGEYFFMGQKRGQGRSIHIDYSCNNTWSAQVVGRKIWRLYSPSHPKSNLFREMNGKNFKSITKNKEKGELGVGGD